MKKIHTQISPYPARCPRTRGFSLVELIVVIVVTGIMASTVGLFIAGPIQAFFDQARRGGLVDAAQLAQLRMGRDLRGALPNSVRVSGGTAIEMLYTLDGDRYRTEPPGTAADRLEFIPGETTFNTFAELDAPVPLGTSFNAYLAIYPLQAVLTGANPYRTTADRAMTGLASLTINAVPNPGGVGNEYQISMPAYQFQFDSPSKRVFLVEGPVSYVCDIPSGELRRYSGYAVAVTQPVPPAGTAVVIVKNVSACNFVYNPGTAQRNAVVSLALTLTAQGESIRLLRQVQVDNSP